MKRMIAAMLTSAALLSPLHIHAENDAQAQIDQLQIEIAEKQAEVSRLKQTLVGDVDSIEFEHDDLKFTIQIEVSSLEEPVDYLEDTYVKLHLTIENMSDAAVSFDPDNFKMYLAEVQQPTVVGPENYLEHQAIPEKSIVEGIIYFNATEAVSNSKDLVVRYQPDESVFEFKVNDYKRIDSQEVAANKSLENQISNKDHLDLEVSNFENYGAFYEEDYEPGFNGYNPQGLEVPYEGDYYEDDELVYFSEVYQTDLDKIEIDYDTQQWLEDFK